MNPNLSTPKANVFDVVLHAKYSFVFSKKMLIIELVFHNNPFANLNNTTIKRVTNPVVY
jgi:hypothetical protein